MKIWLDDIRTPPNEDYAWVYSVNQAKTLIETYEKNNIKIDFLDLDHDLGENFYNGGDGIKLLDWLEETGRNYKIFLHTQNPVGYQQMKTIIDRNKWY